jgi:hypothetical protein
MRHLPEQHSGALRLRAGGLRHGGNCRNCGCCVRMRREKEKTWKKRGSDTFWGWGEGGRTCDCLWGTPSSGRGRPGPSGRLLGRLSTAAWTLLLDAPPYSGRLRWTTWTPALDVEPPWTWTLALWTTPLDLTLDMDGLAVPVPWTHVLDVGSLDASLGPLSGRGQPCWTGALDASAGRGLSGQLPWTSLWTWTALLDRCRGRFCWTWASGRLTWTLLLDLLWTAALDRGVLLG